MLIEIKNKLKIPYPNPDPKHNSPIPKLLTITKNKIALNHPPQPKITPKHPAIKTKINLKIPHNPAPTTPKLNLKQKQINPITITHIKKHNKISIEQYYGAVLGYGETG